MSEQLTLQEIARHRGTVDLDERPRPAHTELMDRPRDQVLAGTRLAADEDGDVRARGLADDLADLVHLRALPERELVLKAVTPVVVSLAAPGTHRSGDGTLDRVFEVFRSERLLEDVIGAEGRCLGDPLDAAAIGDDDDRPRSAALDLEAPQKVDAIGLGGIEIHQAQHELVAAEGGESFLDRLRDHGLVA